VSKTQDFLDLALMQETDECILWPFSIDDRGYGSMGVGRKSTRRSHVAMCEMAHGPKPSPDLEVAHKCGNRPCINKRHVRWATRVENAADRVEHGTLTRGSKCGGKLTEAQVIEIRALAGSLSHTKIGKQFGVSQPVVSRIISREYWGWL
jgi:hypothetical protein